MAHFKCSKIDEIMIMCDAMISEGFSLSWNA